MEKLLSAVIDGGRANGVGVSFHPQGGKTPLLNDVPRRAADHLAEHPDDWVFALPDLYPMAPFRGGENAHESFDELERLLRARFQSRASERRMPPEMSVRFKVHCLKHDLEALLLAAPERLRERLGTRDRLTGAWRLPVEDQNDDKPPKRIVEDLFRRYRRKGNYVDTIDGPWILGNADLAAIEDACPQRFAPFVRDLRIACRTG
jgi:hypothetical protein